MGKINSTITINVDRGTPVLFYRGDFDPKATYRFDEEYRDYVRRIINGEKFYFTVKKRFDEVTGVTPVPGEPNDRWQEAYQLGFLAAGAITADMIDVNTLVVRFLCTSVTKTEPRIEIDGDSNSMKIYDTRNNPVVSLHPNALSKTNNLTELYEFNDFELDTPSCLIMLRGNPQIQLEKGKRNIITMPSYTISGLSRDSATGAYKFIHLTIELYIGSNKLLLSEYTTAAASVSAVYIYSRTVEVPEEYLTEDITYAQLYGCADIKITGTTTTQVQLQFNDLFKVQKIQYPSVEITPKGMQLISTDKSFMRLSFDENDLLSWVYKGNLPDFPGILGFGRVKYDSLALTTNVSVIFVMGVFQSARMVGTLMRITHNIGHSRYTVHLTPNQNVQCYVTNMNGVYFDIAFASDTQNTYKDVCFMIVGDNK